MAEQSEGAIEAADLGEAVDAMASALALKDEGNGLFKAGDYAGAVEKYSEAVSVLKEAEADEDAVVLCNRAAAYIMIGRFVPALRDAQLACEIRPTWWKAHWRQGVALMRLTPKKFRSKAAVAAFETCAACDDLPESKRGEVQAELRKARARLEQQEADTPMPEQCAPS